METSRYTTTPRGITQDPRNAGRHRVWRTLTVSAIISLMALATSPAPAADFYWSGGSASSDNIDQNDNWWNNSHPGSGDNLYFNSTSGSRHGPYSDFGSASWFNNLITYAGAGGIKWRGDATRALKFENNSDANLFEIEASIGNLSNPDQDLELDPSGAGGIKVDNSVTITGGKQIKVSGANTLTFAGSISGSAATLVVLGSGTVVLAGPANNTYSGLTTVNSGTLSLGMRTAGLNAFGGDLTINGGTVNYANSTDNQIPDTANVTINAGGTLAFGARNETIGQTSPSAAGSFAVNGGFVTMGSGTVTLARNPSITGGTVMLAGLSSVLEADQELVFNGGKIDFSYGLSGGPRLVLHGGDGTGITFQSSATTAALISNSGNHGVLALNQSATTVFTVADVPGLNTELEIDVPMIDTVTSAIRKDGAGRLLLLGANTYSGATIISAGTLALGNGTMSAGSISPLSSVSIAAGATFDVSGLGASATYTLGSGASLSASGTGTAVGITAAAIKGGSSGTVSLGSRPLTLTYDGSHPALYISQGKLSLHGNAFTVNNVSGMALGCGAYTIIQQASGNISTGGNCSVNVAGNGQVANSTASISVAGGTVLLNITGCASPAQLNMCGTGSFCSSAGSQVFGVSGATESDVTYSLQKDGTTVESQTGTGSAIVFAGQSAVGTYTVVGARGYSTTTMNGSATIHDSPVAPVPNVSFNLAPSLSLKIKISELLAGWTGSSLSLQSAGPTSAAGGSVTKDSAYIFYLPPSGSVASDHIPYTVCGANGCATTANIDLTIVAPGGIAQTITVCGGTAISHFYGIPGLQYDVQRATSLGPRPPADWTTITPGSPLTASANDGSFTYTDSNAPTGTAYYRSLNH